MKSNYYEVTEKIPLEDFHRILTTDVLFKARFYYAQRNYFRLVCYLNTVYESPKLEELSRQYFTTARPCYLTAILNYMRLLPKLSDL